MTNATEAAAASSASSSQKAAATPTSSNTDYVRTTPTPGVRNVDYPPYVIVSELSLLALVGFSLSVQAVDVDFCDVWIAISVKKMSYLNYNLNQLAPLNFEIHYSSSPNS